MNIRKNARDLTDREIKTFLGALKALKAEMRNVPGGTINHYDVFAAIHLGVTYKMRNGAPLPLGARNGGHNNAGFLSWHREFLLRIERELQRVSNNPSLSVPYWDWTDADTTFNKVFTDEFMGPNGTGDQVTLPGVGNLGRALETGPFTRHNGWRVDCRVHLYRAHSTNSLGDQLCRQLGSRQSLPEANQISDLLHLDDYGSFRAALEADPEMHNDMHYWVRGSMLAHSSPVDPIFLMNHANVDRIWALWQSFGHSGKAFYPATGEPQGHNLDDPMWPWDGVNTGVVTRTDIWNLIPPTTDSVTPNDVLDCGVLGYAYTGWDDVKRILDKAVTTWKAKTGVSPDLTVHNPTGPFGWSTRQELLKSSAFGQLLIDPSSIGGSAGVATPLVQVLNGDFPDVPQMPKGGPYLSTQEISELAHWIDSGPVIGPPEPLRLAGVPEDWLQKASNFQRADEQYGD